MNIDKFVRNLNKIPSFWISRVQILDHEPVREPNGTPTNEVAILKRSLKRLVFRLDGFTSFDCEVLGDKNLKDLRVIWNVAHTSNTLQFEGSCARLGLRDPHQFERSRDFLGSGTVLAPRDSILQRPRLQALRRPP